MSVLLEPVQIGDLKLRNRIFMAPLTRSRAIDNRIPNQLMAEYYAQRASAGLILSEATAVDPMGVGYANTPGIWSAEQIEGWKKIVEGVHGLGGKILLQLWHVGRISHPMFLNGALPIAPSAIAPNGHVSIVRPKVSYVIPRALELSEIPDLVAAFRRGAQNAKSAGFDGVEIHGANGYIIDQFMQDSANKRTDPYGGSIENRVRLALEVADACVEVWGAGKVGFHIAPRGDTASMGDSNPEALFTYLASELGKRKLAFICSREHQGPGYLGDKIRKAFGGSYLVNEKLEKSTAEDLISSQRADAAVFGLKFISNPDLPRRFKENLELTPTDFETLYSGAPKGYTDYPAYEGN